MGSGAYPSGTPAALEALLRNTTPRALHDAHSVSSAPLSPREAFVLSLVDGRTRVSALIDITSMPDEEVLDILHRLRRLGLVTLG